ncbi:MAG: peptide chain release factor N(5)-glutamine methyltransferase [Alphaproteobacteria bacterium]|nr:peptide chain release factor N(5)-glutamine methyltransferase [Alphaproteobacteria bacterium]
MKINQAFTILQSAGGVRAARIITDNTKNLTNFKVWRMARQLRRSVPVAKIIHQKWFWGICFYTNKYTLDPRPDTETLVEAVISDTPKDSAPRILDLGTGTGCIIAAIAKNIPNASGVGIDKSWAARRVARRNIKNLNLDSRIQIRRGDFTHPNTKLGQFDIIVSNPPYIAFDDSRVDSGAMHDPKIALFADENGLAAYRAIAETAKQWIKCGGKIYLEIGIDQDIAVRDIFVRAGWNFIRAQSDLGGITRVLVFEFK